MCRTQAFDVTPYAKALTYYLLGHPGTQDFGRKFKIAFSGCRDEACGLVRAARHRRCRCRSGRQAGFEFYVGGGLGTVPQQAKLFSEFVSEEELLPLCLAIGRVFAKYGEKKNRNTARSEVPDQQDRVRRVSSGVSRRNGPRSSPIRAGRNICSTSPIPTSSRSRTAEFLQIKNAARR